MRQIFGVSKDGVFPVVYCLDQLSDVFPDCNYEIVEDVKMPSTTMARCYQNERCGFTIEIKESIYQGAYEYQTGAFMGFICHELCHVFLFKIGFIPIYERSFSENKLPPYCSVEWQAKALCAEVMIPFNESRGMLQDELIERYHVSKAFAEHRRKPGRNCPRIKKTH